MDKTKLLLFLMFFFRLGFSQQKIEGFVFDNENKKPVAFASVLSGKGSGIITDSSGKFLLRIPNSVKLSDTIVISAIGYKQNKTTFGDLLKNKLVELEKSAYNLEELKVYSSLKGDYHKFGYFRSWNVKNKGGEIGYIFDLPRNKFQIGIIQVKINDNFDTCRLRLHLREVAISGISLPEKEILKEEVVLMTTEKNGLLEFDLKWKEIYLPTKRIFIGFELLNCCCSTSATPSFFFVGNEEGQNYYKETSQSEWKSGGDYTIYVRMLIK